jgi:tRNA A-37 threonylcarbamoyl transferase component Bud32
MRDDANMSGFPVNRDELLPGTQIGDYLVEGFLGEGGMATVYAGRHPIIGRRVAIKVIRHSLCQSIEAVERFIQEARAANEIGHPNIVDVFTFGTLPDGRCYFVMEWLKGRTLAEILDTDGPLPLADATRALAQICDGLQAAHRAGIVHRDLKPQNVFFVEPDEGRRFVKLLDFGIAKLVGRPEGRTTHTQPGLTMGTPDYISPEQARGRVVDGAADIYSLGVVAFEMATGHLPFIADNAADMMAMHLGAEPRAPSSVCPELPAGFDALVGRMLKKDAAERPDPQQVRAALATLVASPADGARRPSRPRVAVGAALSVLAIALLAFRVADNHALLPAIAAIAAAPAPRLPIPAPPAAAARPAPAPTRPGELIIRPRPPHATVRVDGQLLAEEDGARRRRFDTPGTHVVKVSAPGHRPVRLEVKVDEDRTVVVPVRLWPLPPPPPTRRAAMATSADDYYTIDPWAEP